MVDHDLEEAAHNAKTPVEAVSKQRQIISKYFDPKPKPGATQQFRTPTPGRKVAS